jgi:hypothetical protein
MMREGHYQRNVSIAVAIWLRLTGCFFLVYNSIASSIMHG